MNPADLKIWLDVLNQQPILSVVLIWGILELRRFFAALRTHMHDEEQTLREIKNCLDRPTRPRPR